MNKPVMPETTMTTERDEAVRAVQTAIAEADGYADEFDYYRPHALAAIAALRDGEGSDWKAWSELERFVEEAREAFLGHPSSGIFRAIGKKLSAMTSPPTPQQPEAQAVALWVNPDGGQITPKEYSVLRAAGLAWNYRPLIYGTHPTTPAVGGERCTCPSGDGSLRWPCPRHPPEQPSGEGMVQTVNPEHPDLSTEIPLTDLLGEAERVAANLKKTGHYLAATLMRTLAALATKPAKGGEG